MLKDIYLFLSPQESLGQKTGLFADSTGKLANTIVGEKDQKPITLRKLYHGYCLQFAWYAHTQLPDWNIGFLTYNSWAGEQHKHVFLHKKTSDGRILLQDARGITDDINEFFGEYSFSKNTTHLYMSRSSMVSHSSTTKNFRISKRNVWIFFFP